MVVGTLNCNILVGGKTGGKTGSETGDETGSETGGLVVGTYVTLCLLPPPLYPMAMGTLNCNILVGGETGSKTGSEPGSETGSETGGLVVGTWWWGPVSLLVCPPLYPMVMGTLNCNILVGQQREQDRGGRQGAWWWGP